MTKPSDVNGLIEYRSGEVLYELGPLVCPRCGRRAYHVDGYGILRMFCTGTSVCRAPWLAIRLPLHSTAADLTLIYGIDVSRGIVSGLAPATEILSDEIFNTIRLVWTDIPLYIQKSMSNVEAHRPVDSVVRRGAAQMLIGGGFFV